MKPLQIGLLGIDHRHSFGMLGGMLATGGACKAWWTEGTPATHAGFVKRFPDVPRVATDEEILDDPSIVLVLNAAIPCFRADLVSRCMERGKVVLLDKPGCSSLEDLARIRAAGE